MAIGTVSIDTQPVEALEGEQSFVFQVTRSGAMDSTVQVPWSVQRSHTPIAASASDFVPFGLPAGVLIFAPGQTTASITLATVDNDAISSRRAFTVTLGTPAATNPVQQVVLIDATVKGTIVDNDSRVAIAPLAAVHAEGSSGTTPFTFLLTRTGYLGKEGSVAYRVAGASVALDENDFAGGVLPFGTVTFLPGESTRTLTIDVAGDTIAEPNELFNVSLTRIAGGPLLGTALASGTIQNDDGLATGELSIAAVDAVRLEGTGAPTPFTFRVTRSGDLTGTASAAWYVDGGSAPGTFPTAVQDFADGIRWGTIAFAPGESEQIVSVMVAGDSDVEYRESFDIFLSFVAAGATTGTGSATGIIIDDDINFVISPDTVTHLEGDSGHTEYTFTVTRNGAAAEAATIDWSVAGTILRPATASDFASGALPSGQLAFAPWEPQRTLTVLVGADTEVETDETFSVTLANPSDGAVLLKPTAHATILADDAIVDYAAILGAQGEAYPVAPAFYRGPVAGLEKELVYAGTENATVTASGPNWFIRTGDGTDAIAVASGRNVLDGGAGSNFLTGGSGPDTFFVDARSAADTVWSTFVGFGTGDDATIWGIRPDLHTLAWADGEGAENFLGLTLHATALEREPVALTLTGYTRADLDAGRLSISFGTSDIYRYMHIALVADPT
jgi:hypothetical protein